MKAFPVPKMSVRVVWNGGAGTAWGPSESLDMEYTSAAGEEYWAWEQAASCKQIKWFSWWHDWRLYLQNGFKQFGYLQPKTQDRSLEKELKPWSMEDRKLLTLTFLPLTYFFSPVHCPSASLHILHCIILFSDFPGLSRKPFLILDVSFLLAQDQQLINSLFKFKTVFYCWINI